MASSPTDLNAPRKKKFRCRGGASRKSNSTSLARYRPAFSKEYRSEKIGLGITNPRTDEIEPAEEIVTRVTQLDQPSGPAKIRLNPDGGFDTLTERSVNSAETA
jgi:methionine synthase II (cobalamin-independent)